MSAVDPATLLRKSAALYPDNVASICEDHRQTYAELFDRSKRLANALREAGLEPGDRVAILSDNSAESLEQIAGLALGGYVRCPLYTHDTAERHIYLLRLTGARALIVQEKYYDAVRDELDKADDLRVVLVVGAERGTMAAYEAALISAPAADPEVELRADDTHVIRFSAGTTGMSKGIAHTVRGWMDMGNEFTIALAGFREEDVYLAGGPLSHGSGLIAWPLIAVGATTVVMPVFDTARYLELVERERATVAILVPTMIQMVISDPTVSERDLASLRLVIYGASPIAESTLTSALAVWGNIMHQTYGQSEALPITTLAPRYHCPAGTPEQRRWLRSAGRPTPNTAVRIVDDQGNELPLGEVGEVLVRTPGSMSEIWGSPDATAERMTPDGWVRTRDMGSLSTDGFLYLADRKEDVIISGGFNIWPAELENALVAHPAVAEASVVGVPHPRWGETPRAAVVLNDGADVSERELIDWTKERVGSVHKVTGVRFVAELPKTPVGKVLRRVVRERYLGVESAISGA